MQQLRDHEVRDRVVDGRAEEDDPLVEQPGVDVELALAAGGALDDHGDERHAGSLADRTPRLRRGSFASGDAFDGAVGPDR